MNKIGTAFIILLISTSATLAASAVRFGCTKPLRIGLYEMGILYSSQTKKGADKDVAEILSQKTNCPIEFVVMPRARIWQLIERGELDITLSALANDEREAFAAFSPYVLAENYAILDKSLHKVKTLEDIASLPKEARFNVGVVRSFAYGKEIDAFLKTAKSRGIVIEFASLNELFQAVEKHQVKVTFGSLEALQDFVNRPNVKDHIIVRSVMKDKIPAHVVFSKKNFTPEQLKAWNEVVAGILKDGTVKKVFRKYIPEKIYSDFSIKTRF